MLPNRPYDLELVQMWNMARTYDCRCYLVFVFGWPSLHAGDHRPEAQPGALTHLVDGGRLVSISGSRITLLSCDAPTHCLPRTLTTTTIQGAEA